jgi:hypothetical protein
MCGIFIAIACLTGEPLTFCEAAAMKMNNPLAADDLDMQDLRGDGYATARPVRNILRWEGELERRGEALAFELQINGWSRAKKKALIRGDWHAIHLLAKSKTGEQCGNAKGRTKEKQGV